MPAENRVDPHAAFRFAVQIEGINEAVFCECALPAFEVELHEQKEGGYNGGVHQLPGRIKAGRIALKRGVTDSNELLQWYQNGHCSKDIGTWRGEAPPGPPGEPGGPV